MAIESFDLLDKNITVNKLTGGTNVQSSDHKDILYDKIISLLEGNNNRYQQEIQALKNENFSTKQEVLFYKKKSDILEVKVEFLFNRVKKVNPIIAMFFESFSEYREKLNKKLSQFLPKVKKKNKKITPLRSLVDYARTNPSVSYQDSFAIKLSKFSTELFLDYFDEIKKTAFQLKTFNVFSDYVFKNINDIVEKLYLNKTSSSDCIWTIKALHYNQDFYKLSITERYNIVEALVYFLCHNSRKKIDNSVIEGAILLFATTDKKCYESFLNKYNISNADIIYNKHFVDYFVSHPLLSYQMCDSHYGKYLEKNINAGVGYIGASLLMRLFNQENYFDDIVTLFLGLGVKQQRKILDIIKKRYEHFEKIDLKLKDTCDINIYGYIFISFFKNARDYITDEALKSLEENATLEDKELLLFIRYRLGDKHILHRYINQKISDKSLAIIPFNFSSIKNLFQNINTMQVPKSDKDYTCSVILTTHNPDIEFLTLSLDSLINQTLKNVEIFIIDDCSDNSEEIKELQAKSNMIKYIRNDINQGAYISRNIAIKHATGEYIFFQDDDDVSHPQRLEYSIDNLLQSNAKIFHTCGMRFTSFGSVQLDTSAVVSSGAPVTMCFHRKTFEELGEFMPFRSRGDVEYRARCVKRFGKDAYLSPMDVPLYYAWGGVNSLSSIFEAGASFYNLSINRTIISESVL